MDSSERQQLITKYAAGYDEVLAAMEGFPANRLHEHLIPGKWSAKEILHHLSDSETTAAIRLRRLLVEDNPVIQGYDQDEFAIRLKYNDRDLKPALDSFRAARETTKQILDQMSDEDWKRDGVHTENGKYTPEHWLMIYAAHAHNHAAQIRALRDKL